MKNRTKYILITLLFVGMFFVFFCFLLKHLMFLIENRAESEHTCLLFFAQDNFLEKRQITDKQHSLTLLKIFWSDIVPCSWYCFFVYLESTSPCLSSKVLPQDKSFEWHSFLSIWMSTSNSWHRCSFGLQFSLVTSELLDLLCLWNTWEGEEDNCPKLPHT